MKLIVSCSLILILIIFSFIKMGLDSYVDDDYLEESEDNVVQSYKKVENLYSLKNKVTKAKKSIASAQQEDLISGHHERLQEIDSYNHQMIESLKHEYYNHMALDQYQFSKSLKKLQKDHEAILTTASKYNVPLSDIDYLSPQMTYFLMFTKKYSDPSNINLQEIDFSSEDWKYVRRFVNSDHFYNLLNQNKLAQKNTTSAYLKTKFTTRQDLEIEERLRVHQEEKRKIASEDTEFDY